MAITLDEAFIRAAKHFYDGNSFDETAKVKGSPSKYPHAVFDDYEKDLTKRKGSMDKKEVTKNEDTPVKGQDNGDS